VTPQAHAVLELFRSTGAYLNGHFRLSSGLHSNQYLQCALVLQFPQQAEKLGQWLAQTLRSMDASADVVVSPALGGVLIGHEVARALGVRFLFTERDSSREMTLRRGFAVTPGEKAIVVEDVITTGGSTREVLDVLRKCGAHPLAAGAIIDRSGGKADLGTPLVALATLEAAAFSPEQCPLCAQGVPLVKPGSRPT
jgi:orotate phosphoribosyltransferase